MNAAMRAAMNAAMRAMALVLFLSSAAGAAEKRSLPTASDEVDLLRLDLPMARFLVKNVASKLDPEARAQALIDAILDKKKLGISYDDRGTKTAAETFRSRSGNCLSFTVLFVAMARHLGLNAYFEEVGEVMSWDRRGDLILRNHHMLAEVEVENGHMQVDFLPGGEKRYRELRRVGESRVLAHYYNNLGVEHLADGDAEKALAYFEQSVAADDTFSHAWTNLGVAYRHLGDFERAEASHLRALEAEADEPTALTNLASLYLAEGRREEAQPILAKVEGHLRRNPYHHFTLGTNAARLGDSAAAVRHFREAIRRLPDEPEFHAALADALAKTGELDKARQSLEKALSLAEDGDLKRRIRSRLAALEKQQ